MFSRFLSIFTFSNATLLVALALSTIAAWYSIVGLTAIFAAAVIPIIIMGSALELAKIITTVWLRKYWQRCTWIMKVYLVPAVVALALLTSMGIFGFLSKAHLDQAVPSSDIAAKVSLLDEKIKTERDNIDAAKRALTQMDSQVDQMLGRTDSDRGAERAVQIRRQQAKERNALQNDIAKSQAVIAKLNEERAPIASELRKVEAEVGPIKYIAALIYGDNPDANLLERAVRWVIILLVIVFDPLAIMLVIAANQSKDWDKEELIEDDKNIMAIIPPKEEDIDLFTEEEIPALDTEPIATWPFPSEKTSSVKEEPITEFQIAKQNETFTDNQLTQLKELIASLSKPEKPDYSDIEIVPVHTKYEEPVVEVQPEEIIDVIEPEEVISDDTPNYEGFKDPNTGKWTQTGPDFVPITSQPSFVKFDGDYAEYKGKHVHKRVLYDQFPELKLEEDKRRSSNTRFGTDFPNTKMLGDVFVRVDVTPNRVYKYNGAKWIETSKNISSTYLANPEYVQFLIGKLASGEYDMDLLTVDEQDAVEKHLKTG
jgi:outer membrane murein-binding lipoprotein Lpp